MHDCPTSVYKKIKYCSCTIQHPVLYLLHYLLLFTLQSSTTDVHKLYSVFIIQQNAYQYNIYSYARITNTIMIHVI